MTELNVKHIHKTFKRYLVFIILNILDCILTLIALNNNAIELNPINVIILKTGILTFILHKSILPILISITLWKIENKYNYNFNQIIYIITSTFVIVTLITGYSAICW